MKSTSGKDLGKGTLASMCIAVLCLTGCILTHPGGTSLAYVEVKGVSLERVREATVQVFGAERYQVEAAQANGFVFVRDATLNDRLQYARYDESLFMRADVTYEPFGPDTILVRVDAYAVSGGATETKLLRIARRPYMKMLRSVKKTALATSIAEGE